MAQNRSFLKIPLLVVAAVSVIVGALGVFDLKNVPYGGYFTNPTSEVILVFPDGPAERAGLQVGDRLTSIGGISVQDARALAERPRAAIGESRSFVVDRGGQTLELDLVYAEQPGRNRSLGIAAALIGLCYLGFGLWPFVKAANPHTVVLALFGVCFGVAFLPGPYSPSYALRALGGAVATLAIVLGFAFLLHFLLEFPKRRPFLDGLWARRLIYGPAIFIALFLMFRIIFQPQATSALNAVTNILVGMFVVGYFGWAMVAMIQSYLRASPGERSNHGLNFMLLGTIFGLVPVTVSSLVGAIAPSMVLPGVQFYFLTLVLIPISFAFAAVRRGSA